MIQTKIDEIVVQVCFVDTRMEVIYHIPQSMDSNDFLSFKTKYAEQIQQLKTLAYEQIGKEEK